MAADLTPPSPIATIGEEDIARIEQWAARHRAELSRLALALRNAQRRAERAERAADEALRDVPEVQAPEDLLLVLDTMFDAAVQKAELSIQAARREAAALVAAGREQAGEELRARGLDPEEVFGDSTWTSAAVADLIRPVSGRAMWELELDRRAAAPELEPLEAKPPFEVDEPEPDRELEPVAVAEADDLFPDGWNLPDSDDPLRQLVPVAVGRPPPRDEPPDTIDLTPSPPSTPRTPDDEVRFDDFWTGAGIDVFWGEVEDARRPLRDRLRRREMHGRP